jgi:hypothetical protein
LLLNCSLEATCPSVPAEQRVRDLAALRAQAALAGELVDRVAHAVADHDALVRIERAATDQLPPQSATGRRRLVHLPAFASGVVGAPELVEMAKRLVEPAAVP